MHIHRIFGRNRSNIFGSWSIKSIYTQRWVYPITCTAPIETKWWELHLIWAYPWAFKVEKKFKWSNCHKYHNSKITNDAFCWERKVNFKFNQKSFFFSTIDKRNINICHRLKRKYTYSTHNTVCWYTDGVFECCYTHIYIDVLLHSSLDGATEHFWKTSHIQSSGWDREKMKRTERTWKHTAKQVINLHTKSLFATKVLLAIVLKAISLPHTIVWHEN